MPVFKETHFISLQRQECESGEDRSDPNDGYIEIEDYSVREGFDQNESNDLVRDLSLSQIDCHRQMPTD